MDRSRLILFFLMAAGLFWPWTGQSDGQEREGGQCLAGGGVSDDFFSLSGRQVQAREKAYALVKGQAQLQKGDYRLRADRMIYDSKREFLRAEDRVMFTRCDPKDPIWFIAADRLTINEREARMKNAWFIFGGAPLFYLPRYKVGLNRQRQSGFLRPKIDNSSDSGFGFGAPYYLNLAPNRDATLTPRYLSKRGLQLRGNFRYLNRLDAGAINVEWLNSRRRKGDRYAYSLEHQFHKGDYLNFDLSIQKLSDADYYRDLGDSLDKTAENYLASFAHLDYVVRGWSFSAVGESLQRADTNVRNENHPYVQWPKLSLNKTWYGKTGLSLELDSSWANFKNRRSSDRPEGKRLNNSLRLQWDYRHPRFFIKPSVALQNTRYSLSRTDDHQDNSIRRTAPVFSLHTGLTFSKALDDQFHHVVEPQLFYLRLSERRQEDIPLFDTGESDFNFSQLFRHNRFNSHDRLGDADRLVGALTTRIIHSRTGKEALRTSFGHIEQLSRERVGLRERLANNNASADFAAELALNMDGRIRWQGAWAYDHDFNQTTHYNSRLSLVGKDNRALSMSYHYRRDESRQVHLDFSQPLGDSWNLLAAWQYDVRNSRDLDALFGVEYKSCCWGLRLLAQKYLRDIDLDNTRDYNRSIGLEFSLSGIGNAGGGDSVLRRKINNYRPF